MRRKKIRRIPNSDEPKTDTIVRSKPKKKEKIVSYDVEITPKNNSHGIKSQKWDMRKEDDDRKKFDDYFESEVVKEQNRRRHR